MQRSERVVARAVAAESYGVFSRRHMTEIERERVKRDDALVLAVEEHPDERSAVFGDLDCEVAVRRRYLLVVFDVSGVEGKAPETLPTNIRAFPEER